MDTEKSQERGLILQDDERNTLMGTHREKVRTSSLFIMYSFIKRHISPLVIFFVTLTLFIANFKNGTTLAGWDHLQIDLYPSLAVKRAFFAVWEEYQGLGLTSGMAHASDLVHAVMVWLLSFALPQSILRYTLNFILFFVGGLGFLKMMEQFGFTGKKRLYGLLGSLFYLFNLGTIQMFYVPFEPFSYFFAFLPWEIWILSQLFSEKRMEKKTILLFTLINVLATPQAYLQTLFIVYLLICACFSVELLIRTKTLDSLKKIAFALAIIFAVNAFWILPQVYFLRTNGQVVNQAKINQLATEDVYYQNHEKGTLKNFVKLEGFYFDLFRTNEQRLFLEWRDHFSTTPTSALPYLFTVVVLIGFLAKDKKKWGFLAFYTLCAVALLSATPGFEQMNKLLRMNGFVNQIFRSPFTKFIVPYSLVTSYFFALGLALLGDRLPSRAKIGGFAVALLFIGWYAFPAFRGYLFAPSMQVTIPKEYQNTISYFKTQDTNKRIALLPDQTFWGWLYTKWGYNGSGFIWYGIEQPILSRTFDVWSGAGEQYFWEVKSATEKENVDEFNNVLEKYNVDFILLDTSQLPISSALKGLQYDRLNKMLKEDKKVTEVRKDGSITIYKVTHNKKIESFVSVSPSLPSYGPKTSIESRDNAYANSAGYINDEKTPSVYFPFRDLTSQKRVPQPSWQITENDRSFILEKPLPIALNDYQLSTSSASYKALLNSPRGVRTYESGFTIHLAENRIQVEIPKALVRTFDLTKTMLSNCARRNGIISVDKILSGISIKANSGAIACFGYSDEFLEQRYGYITTLSTKNIEGRGLFFYILDNTKRQSYLEERLRNSDRYFLIAPRYQYGRGYNFTFQGDSYENLASQNNLSELKVYLFPYDQVREITLVRKGVQQKKAAHVEEFKAKKISYYQYEITLPASQKEGYVELHQAYDPGWKAYLNGQELTQHVVIDNWANGWKFQVTDVTKSPQTITIVYWPQYLEFIGFLIAVGVILLVYFLA